MDREIGQLDLLKTNQTDLIIPDSASSVFEKKKKCVFCFYFCVLPVLRISQFGLGPV